MIVRDHEAGGRWYVIGYTYPTDLMAKRAWERVERKLTRRAAEAGAGVYRLAPWKNPPADTTETGADGLPAVAVVTLDHGMMLRAHRLLGDGTEFDPVPEFADRLILRRAHVVLAEQRAHPGEAGRVRIRRPEDRGASIDSSGHMWEQRGGQG